MRREAGQELTAFCTRNAQVGETMWEGATFPISCDSAQFVALGLPSCPQHGNNPPKTIVFAPAEVKLASISVDGSDGHRHFFGFNLNSTACASNAEMEIQEELLGADGYDKQLRFSLVASEVISAGDPIVCQRYA